MGPRIQVCLLVIIIQILFVAATTDPSDVTALNALKTIWKNTPPNWVGPDPCGTSWDGILCNNSRVTSMILAGTNLIGSLSSDILSLSDLQYLDLSNNKGLTGTIPSAIGNLKNLSFLMLIGCDFFGPIPDSIGSLQNLVFLALNNNSFSGPIPPSIGNLFSLSWLDLTENKLSGKIIVSNGKTAGLDMLLNAKHFHLGHNHLVGNIQSQLFNSSMKLTHVVLDNNQLTGEIPSTLGSVQILDVVRLDWNSLNDSVPSNLNNLTSLKYLFLSNKNLTGPIPNLTGMNFLSYVDMSNNSFNASDVPPWFANIQSLTTIVMERTRLQGNIPVNLFSLPQLERLVLSNNQLNGILDVDTSYSNLLTLVDLQNNSITNFTQRGSNIDFLLAGNPVCERAGVTESYCMVQKSNSSDSTPSNNCTSTVCRSNKVLSPNCTCAFPYSGTLFFLAFSFSKLENSSYSESLAESLMFAFRSSQLAVDSVSLSNPTNDVSSYLQFRLQVFPSGQDQLNRTGVSAIGTLLNQLTSSFGPLFFIDESYCCFAGTRKSSYTGAIVGAAVGGFVLVLVGKINPNQSLF